MADLLFGATRAQAAAVRDAARAAALAFVAEQRALVALFEAARPEQREFVSGEVACLLHVSPHTGAQRLGTALSLLAHPRLVSSLELGRIGVPHALALLREVEQLDAAHAARVLAAVLSESDEQGDVGLTPGELRASARRAAVVVDPDVARRRRAEAEKTAGVRARPGADGMGSIVIDCTATQMATAVAALKNRVAAMALDDPDLTQGQKEVAAFLHALGCDRVPVQAVIECPVDRAVDLQAAAGTAVWSVDVRIPVAVALGLSDHPGVLAGYGPIDADQARALLPAADLVRACVDRTTGEVLTVDPRVRNATWTRATSRGPGTVGGPIEPGAGSPGDEPRDDRARVLRAALVGMATSGGTVVDLTTAGYVPSEALGRLVDLRDLTSVFPGDLTPARRTQRDHRLPWPLGPTSADNLQNIQQRWHRAKHAGWTTVLLDDGTIRWMSPGGGTYQRRPRRVPPPPVPPEQALPPVPQEHLRS